MVKKKKSPRVKPSRDELIKFSHDHLFYEIWMLFEVTELLRHSNQGTPACNALLESFVIHSAILIEFFYDKGIYSSTARASDYINDLMVWNQSIPPYERYFDKIRKRRNTEMAHLSYERLQVSSRDKAWNYSVTSLQLRGITNQFLGLADPKLLHSKIYNLKTQFSPNNNHKNT